MRFYRYQNTDKFENHPSWDGYRQVEVGEPADEDGWEGYYWAYYLDHNEKPVYNDPILIKARDVENALEGNEVDNYVPGLCGTESLEELYTYVTEQVGGIDKESYVAIYEGEKVTSVWDGVVFKPIKLIAIYPAIELPNLIKK